MSGLARVAGAPLAALYGLVIARRNRRYDRGLGVTHLPVRVISIGNLTVGGTGKTPMVTWTVAQLRDAGRRPLIALRGYGARDGRPSDEAEAYRRRLPDVTVVAHPDRAGAVTAALREHADVDVVVLDDGFQHRAVARDLDVVLIDARAGTFHDRLLPAGRLREPVSSLRRAGAVVVTHASGRDDAFAAAIERAHGRPPIAWTRHAWTGLDVLEDGAVRREPVSWLAGRRVATLLGVARPERVRAMLAGAGAAIVEDVPARDHEHFAAAKLERAHRAAATADALVITDKDRARMGDGAFRGTVVVPVLEIEFLDGEARFREALL